MAAQAVSASPDVWERLDDGAGPRRYRCTRHDVEFTQADVFQVGRNSYAHGLCPECLRHPKRPDDLETPDYWTPSKTIALGEVTCEPHGSHFAADEACRSCIEEDLGTDELDRMLRERPIAPVKVDITAVIAGRA